MSRPFVLLTPNRVAFLLFLFNFIDGLLTAIYVVKELGREINPLMNFLLEKDLVYFCLYKFVVASGFIWIIWKLSLLSSNVYTTTLYVLAVYSLLMFWWCWLLFTVPIPL